MSSSYQHPGVALSSQTSIDLSHEAKMAQLKRIQELSNQIESRPSAHHPEFTDANPTFGYDDLAYISPLPTASSTADFGSSLDVAPGPLFPNVQLSDNGSPLTSALSEASVWNDHGHNEREHMDIVHDQAHSSTSSNVALAVGSVFSKSSELSSNTSKETPDRLVKTEDDDVLMASPYDHSAIQSDVYEKQPETNNSTPPVIGANQTGSAQKRRRISKETKLKVSDFKAKTTIPADIPPVELARQSAEAALNSRLNPFVLHPDEYRLLRDHICHLHVSAYLNIRNRILRLWVRNPLVTVTPEEAAGCAYGSRWIGLAEVAYEWLIRRGYINFGCVEVPDFLNSKPKKSGRPRDTIVVVGAGMSGLGCARQLDGLFSHYRDKWTIIGQEPPTVVVLEGRARIGGRVYSHPLSNQSAQRIPRKARCTAEMGAHIITGFDRGNPLNMIIRGQLALHYYPLKDNSSLYDVDGKIVKRERDNLAEKLFNDILDRASVFRHKIPPPVTVGGDREMIEAGKDPSGHSGKPISVVEQEKEQVINKPENLVDMGLDHVPAGVDKLTGKAHVVAGPRRKAPAAIAAEAMGWTLASSAFAGKDLDLDTYASSSTNPTLGGAMDEGIKQYQALLHLGPQDLRLLNWHFANLEYANAANVSKLSLGGWDQDIGNEFEGEHAQVIGGYIQVPRGILQSPTPLDLRTRKPVTHITYNHEAGPQARAKVTCADGESFDASHVVLTTPLGVLKERAISFEPELPGWKTSSIDRLGYGTLNKVILVYEKPFWDVEQDMIGLLRDTDYEDSFNQLDYSKNRGRFYLFWNCIKTSGRPLLIALMAGDAAHQAESMEDGQIVAEVTQQLAKMFRHKPVPPPTETIVTRWGKDKFARGSYSYVGPSAHSDDYDSMARSVGNLHFAGEATCGTHPATVHGAYISGLRAASEVIDSLIGPIEIPTPLVPAVVKNETKAPSMNKPMAVPSQKMEGVPQDGAPHIGESVATKQARLEAFESEILTKIYDKLGLRPFKPEKAGANPFLLYSKDMWGVCKARCDSARRAATGQPTAKASRNEIRAALGQMWREAAEVDKKPYIDQTVSNRESNAENAKGFQDRLAAWDAEAISIRRKHVEEHPGVLSEQEEKDMWQALGVYAGGERQTKKESG
jgi:monoamine oxidase